MTDDATGKARALLASLPPFAGLDTEGLSLDRLGGLTNLVFRVSNGERSWCLRIPGKGTEEYIDRKVEARASRATSDAGVSPALLYADPESGVMVSDYLEGARTMTPEGFAQVVGAPGRAGEVFRKLHDSGATFDFRFELFAMIDDYLKLLSGKTVELPAGYHEALTQAESVRAALAVHPLPLAPCHCDPLCENFLDLDGRMWLVDWEYSGMNDPLWDLGDLSVEAGFDVAQEEEMIQAYFDGEPSPAERGRIVIYKAMCDLLWTLWGLIQFANDNPAEDFWVYATTRFERCKALMADPAFEGHLQAVRRGT